MSRILVACVVIVLLPARSWAQSPAQGVALPAPNPKDAAEGLRRFKAGVKLYGEKAYIEALAEFETSYSLGGRPTALRNVAQCHRDLKHFAEAYEAYDKLLKLHAAQLSPADKEAVAHALEELADLSGTITVTSSEAGAAVDIDGLPLGTTPLDTPKRVSLGAHHLRVTKAGFEPFEKDATVTSGGNVSIAATLATEITTGHVTVREANGAAVDVTVDGQVVGPAPWEGELPPGDHKLQVRGPKSASRERPFSLARKQRLDLTEEAVSTVGHVRITTLPASAMIALDGESVGSGVYDADVAPGPHKIVITLEGAPTAMREVTVQPGQLVVEEIPLVVGFSAGPRVPVYRGFEGRFDFNFAFAPGAGHYQYPASAPTNGTPVDTTGPFTAGMTLRLGYEFDWYAAEFFGSFQFWGGSNSFTAPVPNGGGVTTAPSISGAAIKGIFGVAGRATSKTKTIRFTGSLGIGLSVAQLFYQVKANCNDNGGSSTPCPGPSVMNGSNDYSAQPGYVAPAIVGDLGILLGGTPPGAKFFLGLSWWAEFAPTLEVGPYPNPGYLKPYEDAQNGWKFTYGPVFFIGPVLGVGFGH